MASLTHPRLAEIAAYLDQVRGELSTLVSNTAPELMSHPRPNGRWSGAQIIQHLGKVEGSTTKLLEGLFVGALAKGLGADSATSSMTGSLDRFTGDGRVLRPLVAPERLRPTPDAELEPSWESLQSVRERTYRAYATVDGRDLTQVSAPHPFFGPLDAYQWFLFIGRHEERHLGQLRRELAAG
jgi:hypothetical protein